MLEANLQGFLHIFTLGNLAFMVLGVLIGTVFGIIPGIGGMTAMAILLPVIWGLPPEMALILMIAVNGSNSQGGSITAILINVPGTAPNAATLLDGYPMTQKGQAGRALGAVLTAGALGGLFGAFYMIAMIPIVKPLVLKFSSAELFFTVILGLSFITIITERGGGMFKGLVGGGLGMILAMVGDHPTTGLLRFNFHIEYLMDGVKLIPLVLGMFAFPEIIDLAVGGGKISRSDTKIENIGPDIFEGIKDVFRHFWLFLRCSAIGTVCGTIPGVGADVATWVCYGHAKQSSKHPERFGHGTVEGVIAPESAGNSKEGGSLLTTLAFGIPGSIDMSLLLAAFLVVGITPGPEMLKEHLSLTFSLAWTVITSNVISSVILLVFARQFAKITFVDVRIIAPAVLVFASIGAYAIGSNIWDVVAAYAFTILGYGAKHLGYNRSCIILGYVLGGMAEEYFIISLKAYGPLFPLRPICLILIAITVFGISYKTLAELWRRRQR